MPALLYKLQMAQVQLANQLKFRISSLEIQLVDKQKQIDSFKAVQTDTNAKIKDLNKMHAQKIKSLLNSIQILKKEKASVEGLSKQHKRSKLIQQLNKQIADQDLAIEVLRKYVYDQNGKEQGRQICDQVIIKALTKGPQRIRPLSRQQLRIEIDKLKSINLALESKLKNGFSTKNKGTKQQKDDDGSSVSGVSEASYVNHNEVILNKLKDLQFENQNMKLEVNSKMRIIEKLKNDLKQSEKLKVQIEVLKNEINIAYKKVTAYERVMRDSKQRVNDRLVEAEEGHNLTLAQLQIQRLKLMEQLEQLKKQNEMLIAHQRTQDEQQKKKLDKIKQHNQKYGQLKEKLTLYESEVSKLVKQNESLLQGYRKAEADLFSERAKWVQEKAQFIEEIEELRKHRGQSQLIGKYMTDIDELTQENKKLRDVIEQGGTGEGGNDTLLLERLDNYKRRLQFLEGKSEGKTEGGDYYDGLFNKYNDLAQEFQEYKEKYGKHPKRIKKRQYVEINKDEQGMYQNLSSGISKLNLQDVDSDILDNFDSSYEFEIVLTEDGRKVKLPKVTGADKELLKLISSDIWHFVEEQNKQMVQKINDAEASFVSEQDRFELKAQIRQKIRKMKNISNPRGKRIVMYDQQVDRLNDMSDGVSITSALPKQLQSFDSDINMEFRELNGYQVPKSVNMLDLRNLSMSSGSSVALSSVKSGDSRGGFSKKKPQVKASTISVGMGMKKLDKMSSDAQSVDENKMLNSDVSSLGFSENELNKMDSDIEYDFGKKK